MSAWEIGKTFLDRYDEYICKNYKSMECNEFYELYYKFLHYMKEVKGNANGFTGLSEYLIFRFVYHQLGGNFEIYPVTDDINGFVRKKLRIGQSIPVYKSKNKKCYPDIVVYKEDELRAVIQVKLYLTHGLWEVNNELKTLKALTKLNPKLKSLLLIFYLSRKGKIKMELDRLQTENDWFKYIILEENHNRLYGQLNRCLFKPAKIKTY